MIAAFPTIFRPSIINPSPKKSNDGICTLKYPTSEWLDISTPNKFNTCCQNGNISFKSRCSYDTSWSDAEDYKLRKRWGNCRLGSSCYPMIMPRGSLEVGRLG